MNPEMLLKQVGIVRSITLGLFETINDENADLMPNGFHNTIRWNLGHILIVQDELARHFAQLPNQLPQEYIALFGNRTKPEDWTVQPPSLDLLYTLLENQSHHLKEQLGNRLDEEAVKPFVRLRQEMRTIGEILNFSLYHEGLHQGMINGLKRAIEGSDGKIRRIHP